MGIGRWPVGGCGQAGFLLDGMLSVPMASLIWSSHSRGRNAAIADADRTCASLQLFHHSAAISPCQFSDSYEDHGLAWFAVR